MYTPAFSKYIHTLWKLSYYLSIQSKYFIFEIKHRKLTASTMLNPHMSCLDNSVNPMHATSEKPADQKLH